MTIPEKLTYAINKRGVSIRALSEMTGIAKSAIQRYASGEVETIPIYRLEKLAMALNVSPAWLIGWAEDDQDFSYLDSRRESKPEDDSPLPSNVRPMSELHVQRVPLIGAVAAGEPIYAPEEQGVYVDTPVQCDAAITVQGDSMIPNYLDGDVVYIKCRPDVPDGAVAVVFLDDEATLKHVYKRENGLTLISYNPEHPPLMVEFEDYARVRVFGVPVGYTRMFKPDPLKKIKKGMK